VGGDGITLQNLQNYDEFKTLMLVPCDEIKLLIHNFFIKLDGPMLCPISLFRLGLDRDLCEASITLCGSLDFLQNISS
jgi:hypothetical protein